MNSNLFRLLICVSASPFTSSWGCSVSVNLFYDISLVKEYFFSSVPGKVLSLQHQEQPIHKSPLYSAQCTAHPFLLAQIQMENGA
jgi:hypothetical protein